MPIYRVIYSQKLTGQSTDIQATANVLADHAEAAIATVRTKEVGRGNRGVTVAQIEVLSVHKVTDVDYQDVVA